MQTQFTIRSIDDNTTTIPYHHSKWRIFFARHLNYTPTTTTTKQLLNIDQYELNKLKHDQSFENVQQQSQNNSWNINSQHSTHLITSNHFPLLLFYFEQILIFFSYFFLLITLPFSLIFCLYIIKHYERAVIFRLGHVIWNNSIGPGLLFIIPWLDIVHRVDLRLFTVDVCTQNILTSDAVTVSVETVIYYRIINPILSVIHVKNIHDSTCLLAQTTLHHVLGRMNMYTLLTERQYLSQFIHQLLDIYIDLWGIKIERIEIKNIRLPIELQHCMAIEAEASRKAQAKFVLALAEKNVSHYLKLAAIQLKNCPIGLQLHYLQTMKYITNGKNSIILFPIPMKLKSDVYFELILASLSNSNEKFQLYSRYIKWIEQNYPSLGKCADLQNVLYRSIRDSSNLPEIKNNEAYVNSWIKLTEYCSQPMELFELLFRQGIGTMCSEFYIAWCELLEKKTSKNYQKIASIYAHGLRAGAKPLLWLEDRAEAFFHRYQYYLKSTDDTLMTTLDNSCQENNDTSSNTRKKLASLRLIETVGTQENHSFVAPVLRTNEMWRSNQSGLGPTITTQHSTGTNRLNKNVNYQIKPDNLSCAKENSTLIRDLPIVDTADFIRPVGCPSSWQKENQLEPTAWNNVQLPTNRTAPVLSRPIGLPNWEIFTEEPIESEQQQPQQQQTDSVNTLSSVQQSTVCTKRKGLKIKSFKDNDSCQQSNEIPYIEMASFNRLVGGCGSGSGSVDHALSAIHRDDQNDVKLNLPSLPGDKLCEVDCFAFDISLIYGGIEELCWEMHRSLKWNVNYMDTLNHCSSTSSSSSIKHQQQQADTGDVDEDNSDCDRKKILNNFWDKEETELIEEINAIIHKHTTNTTTNNNNHSNNNDVKCKNVESTRYALIKSLEMIALNQKS
ncbi:unnamed protein product [Schistosoma turkestanicum]|nr:unnamed protein product [Schistosoma turkestanicum]